MEAAMPTTRSTTVAGDLSEELEGLSLTRLVEYTEGGCGLDASVTRGELHDLVGRYRAAGLQRFGVQLSPASQPAIALGYRWFVTETGEDLPTKPNPSFHNMLRAGFRLAYQRPNYLPS